LDAMTGHAFATAMAASTVNGPDDDQLDWNAVNWRKVEEDVRRLRHRIFKASQAGDNRPRAHRACLSRVPGRLARTVLKGPQRSNALGLPDSGVRQHLGDLPDRAGRIREGGGPATPWVVDRAVEQGHPVLP
jgi:hypothetical protein